jgi:hypothetical protein
MTVHEFRLRVDRLREAAGEHDQKLIDDLLAVVDAWVRSDALAVDLPPTCQRWLGHVWFASEEVHAEVDRLSTSLADEVRGIPGMTMNERLWVFALMERWDVASAEERVTIRRKPGAM